MTKLKKKQYREYQRSAETNGFKILEPSNPERADMICIVNPCNPTGDYFSVEPLKEWIKDNVKSGGCVIVGKGEKLIKKCLETYYYYYYY